MESSTIAGATASATKRMAAPEPVDYPSQRTAIAPAHCGRCSFGRRARLHLETAGPRRTEQSPRVVRRPDPSGRPERGQRPPGCARGQHRATIGWRRSAPHRRHKPQQESACCRGLHTELNLPSPLLNALDGETSFGPALRTTGAWHLAPTACGLLRCCFSTHPAVRQEPIGWRRPPRSRPERACAARPRHARIRARAAA